MPPRPPTPPVEAVVMSRWSARDPVVSVLCSTYQHVNLISDAMDGFLSQITEFPFEVIVRDDASTDGTSEILEDYARRYPNVVRLILEPVNRYREVKPLRPLMESARGDFVALCEGDDYWFDTSKLASQYARIVSDPEISLVETGIYNIEDDRVVSKGHGGTRTYFFRRSDLRGPQLDVVGSVPHPDIAMRLYFRSIGRLSYIEQPMAVWRYHAGGHYGPRGRSRPREIQRDDLVSIFTAGAALSDLGNKRAAVLASRELLLRISGTLGVHFTRIPDRIVLPALSTVFRTALRVRRIRLVEVLRRWFR